MLHSPILHEFTGLCTQIAWRAGETVWPNGKSIATAMFVLMGIAFVASTALWFLDKRRKQRPVQ